MERATLLLEMFLFGKLFQLSLVYCVVATMCFTLELFPKKESKEIWMKSKSVIVSIRYS